MDIVIISLVTFFAALLTFFSGFGLGTILTPIMMLYFPVEIAIAFTGVVHFSNNIFKLFIIGKKASKEVLVKFGIPAVLAAFAGSYLLFEFDSNNIFYSYSLNSKIMEVSMIKFIVSALLIVFALFDLIPYFSKLKFGNKIMPFGGFLSGFFGGLTGNQGALRSAFLIKTGLKKEVFIGTTVVISSFVDLTRLSMYASNLLNFDLSTYFSLAFYSITSGIIGSFLGLNLLKKITYKFIRTLVACLIISLALGLLLGIL
ncbi:MAG: sulfite exporter TauE/SafE family protein [Bacteroidota bacterium]|nr:sulfite exporter TauE/SafE family protein [Bacteroidota bacterium]